MEVVFCFRSCEKPEEEDISLTCGYQGSLMKKVVFDLGLKGCIRAHQYIGYSRQSKQV